MLMTREEELLKELLAANEQLMEAIKQYDDLKRVANERKVEDRRLQTVVRLFHAETITSLHIL